MQKLKIIFAILFLFGLNIFSSQAQILKAKVGINGLTCSQCSKSVYMAFKKLDFVKTIDMELEETVAQLDFYADKPIHLEAIKTAIESAGFSLRNIELTVKYTASELTNTPIICEGDYCFYLDRDCNQNGMFSFELIGGDWNANKKLNAQYKDDLEKLPTSNRKNVLGLCKK